MDKALRRMVRWAHNRRTLNVGRGGATSGCRLGAKRFNLLGLNAGLASVIKYPAYVEGTIYFNAGERANPPFAVRSAGAIHEVTSTQSPWRTAWFGARVRGLAAGAAMTATRVGIFPLKCS